ncbi:MAG: recombinase family protein [Clostridiales bacterium]|nr:recombinase family protein [Clostridiales bacterium]
MVKRKGYKDNLTKQKKEKTMDSCVIYARFSSHGQNEQSIEAQVRICKEFAENKGLKCINIYTDKAKTGTNDARPGFQRMIADAQSGAFQYIIVYMFDRFARNRRDSIMYKEMLKEKYGVRVLSALEPIAEDEGGEFYEMFLEWNAEKYSKRLSKRVKDGLDTSVANGTYCGGYLIYGYKIDLEPISGKSGKFIKRVSIKEDEAEVIKFIFEQYDLGMSKMEIAQALNNKGYRYKDKPFKGRTFDKWITNRKYTGEFEFGGRLCNNMYPPIIDKALFQRVQERLNKNKYFLGGQNKAKLTYLLSGKVFCGHCGTEMVSDGGVSKQGIAHHYYTCKKKKKSLCEKRREHKDALELYVVDCVRDFLSDPKNVEIAANDVLAYYEKRTDISTLKSVQTKIFNVEKEVEELADSFVKAKSKLLQDTIEKKMTEYEILLNDLKYQEALLELERGYKITKKDIMEFVAELLKGDRNDKDYQQKIIDNLVSQVYVRDDNTVVYLNIKGGKTIDLLDFDDTNEVLENTKSVRMQSPLARQNKNTECFLLGVFIFEEIINGGFERQVEP